VLNTISRPLALAAGSALVLAGLFAVPAAASAAGTGQIRITEWEYNGSEFVEFTNFDTGSVNLAGWSFSDSGAHAGDVDLSSVGTVAPGESFILSEESAADFRTEWNLPDSIKVVGDNGTNLGRGDAINIYDSTDALVDTLTYNDQSGAGPRTDTASAWPSAESVIGTDNAASWTKSTAGDAEGSWTSKSGFVGSPGVSRFGSAMDWLRINEIETDGSPDWAELINLSTQPLDASGYVLTGRENDVTLTIPSGTVIAPGAVYVAEGGDFKFKKGDKLSLFAPDGTTLLDSYEWGDFHLDTYGRVPNGTGPFVQQATPSKGELNPETTDPGDPGDGGDPSCQTEAPSGSGPAIAGGIAWPGTQDWTVSDNECQFVTPLSGQDVSGLDIDPSNPQVMWAAKNKSHVYRLVKSGDLWVPDTANGWAAGKDIVFPSGSGQPDAEGITVGPDGFLYVTTERDNSANGVPLESVLRFDPNASGATLQPTTQWVLTADLSDVISTSGDADANLGFEGITWVPDSYLTTNGFVDQSTGSAYDPADYPGHGTGLFFTALEKNGHLYAYALNSDGTFHRVASIDTGMPTIEDTQWDPDAQRVWAVADNTSAGSTELLKIDADGAFAVDRVYNRPTGLPDYNLEGFAIAPNSTCVDGVKKVIRSDDGNNGGHSLWSGTIACDLALGPQGPNPPAETDPTVTATPSTVQAGGRTTIEADGLVSGTKYDIVLHSDPVTLGGGIADADGMLSITGIVPADTVPGAHEITVVASIDPATVIASTAFTVTPSATATPPSDEHATPTGDGTKPAALASTGAAPLPWVATGALLLLLGAGVVVARRRAGRESA
jgi:hypothetical protein